MITTAHIITNIPIFTNQSRAAIFFQSFMETAIFFECFSYWYFSFCLNLRHKKVLHFLHLPISQIFYFNANITSKVCSISCFLSKRELTLSDLWTTIYLIILFFILVPFIFFMLRSANYPILVRKVTKDMNTFIL